MSEASHRVLTGEIASGGAANITEDLDDEIDRLRTELSESQAALAAAWGQVRRAEAALRPFDLAHCAVLDGDDPAQLITLHDLRAASEAYHLCEPPRPSPGHEDR